MCGRYSIFTEEEIIEIREIISEINQKFGHETKLKTGEIFPTDTAPILALSDNSIQAQPMTWGFPRWDKKGVIINAKAETALEKNMFRAALLGRRCVVPSTGFYEWQHVDGKAKKDKYLIRLPDTAALYMAGIYNLFRRPDGSEAPVFVILTTEANESVGPIHDRMPVILSRDEKEQWLRDTSGIDRILKRAGPALIISKVS